VVFAERSLTHRALPASRPAEGIVAVPGRWNSLRFRSSPWQPGIARAGATGSPYRPGAGHHFLGNRFIVLVDVLASPEGEGDRRYHAHDDGKDEDEGQAVEEGRADEVGEEGSAGEVGGLGWGEMGEHGRSDSHGRYALHVAPGIYLLAVQTAVGPRCPVLRIVVEAATSTGADVTCDRGIR